NRGGIITCESRQPPRFYTARVKTGHSGDVRSMSGLAESRRGTALGCRPAYALNSRGIDTELSGDLPHSGVPWPTQRGFHLLGVARPPELRSRSPCPRQAHRRSRTKAGANEQNFGK